MDDCNKQQTELLIPEPSEPSGPSSFALTAVPLNFRVNVWQQKVPCWYMMFALLATLAFLTCYLCECANEEAQVGTFRVLVAFEQQQSPNAAHGALTENKWASPDTKLAPAPAPEQPPVHAADSAPSSDESLDSDQASAHAPDPAAAPAQQARLDDSQVTIRHHKHRL